MGLHADVGVGLDELLDEHLDGDVELLWKCIWVLMVLWMWMWLWL